MGFAATDSASSLIIISDGVPKNNVVILSTAMYGVDMIVSVFIARKVSGPKPMSVFLNVTPVR